MAVRVPADLNFNSARENILEIAERSHLCPRTAEPSSCHTAYEGFPATMSNTIQIGTHGPALPETTPATANVIPQPSSASPERTTTC